MSTENDLLDDEKNSDTPQNRESSQNTFQDHRIHLDCFGHRGSDLMNFLVKETNLKHFYQTKPPRTLDVIFGKAPKQSYEKLSFTSKEMEDEFLKLLVGQMEVIAGSCSMGC